MPEPSTAPVTQQASAAVADLATPTGIAGAHASTPSAGARPDADRSQRGARVAGGVRGAVRARARGRHGGDRPHRLARAPAHGAAARSPPPPRLVAGFPTREPPHPARDRREPVAGRAPARGAVPARGMVHGAAELGAQGARPAAAARPGRRGRDRRRPLRGSSFPSGHVLTYVGVYGFLAHLVEAHVDHAVARRAGVAALAGLVGLVGPSRVQQGHHWPSDVLGSYLVGLPAAGDVHRGLPLDKGAAARSPGVTEASTGRGPIVIWNPASGRKVGIQTNVDLDEAGRPRAVRRRRPRDRAVPDRVRGRRRRDRQAGGRGRRWAPDRGGGRRRHVPRRGAGRSSTARGEPAYPAAARDPAARAA